MFERIIHMMRKEFYQALRDPRMGVLIFVAPVIQLLVLGYAVNLDAGVILPGARVLSQPMPLHIDHLPEPRRSARQHPRCGVPAAVVWCPCKRASALVAGQSLVSCRMRRLAVFFGLPSRKKLFR